MGSLAHLAEVKRPIVKEFQELVDNGVQLEVSHLSSLLAHVHIHSTLVDDIKGAQGQDPHLVKLIEEVKKGNVSDFSVDSSGVLRLGSRLCVPNVSDLRDRLGSPSKVTLDINKNSPMEIHEMPTQLATSVTKKVNPPMNSRQKSRQV
ncbi:hypothetical protein SESBI_02892 [Sesbania bispinosa]|nr:hypothetical protein SESBI_02892 [Sesbania bispinosa]